MPAAHAGGGGACGVTESLPFPNARFDLVFCMGLLEHFLDKTCVLSEMVRVARPAAKFRILVFNAGFPVRRLGLYGDVYQLKAKEDVLELADKDRLLAEAGLDVIGRWPDLHPISWA